MFYEKLLTLSMLSKNFSRQHFEIFFIFLGRQFACYVKDYFLWEKIRKNITSLSNAEFAHRVVMVKRPYTYMYCLHVLQNKILIGVFFITPYSQS